LDHFLSGVDGDLPSSAKRQKCGEFENSSVKVEEEARRELFPPPDNADEEEKEEGDEDDPSNVVGRSSKEAIQPKVEGSLSTDGGIQEATNNVDVAATPDTACSFAQVTPDTGHLKGIDGDLSSSAKRPKVEVEANVKVEEEATRELFPPPNNADEEEQEEGGAEEDYPISGIDGELPSSAKLPKVEVEVNVKFEEVTRRELSPPPDNADEDEQEEGDAEEDYLISGVDGELPLSAKLQTVAVEADIKIEEEVKRELSPPPDNADEEEKEEGDTEEDSPIGDTILCVSRHAGKTFRDIAINEPGFVRWVRNREPLRCSELQALLVWLDETDEGRVVSRESKGNEVFGYGQHRGKTFSQVAQRDPSYHKRYLAMQPDPGPVVDRYIAWLGDFL